MLGDTEQALHGQLCRTSSTQRLGRHFHKNVGHKGCPHPISAVPGAVCLVGRGMRGAISGQTLRFVW